MTTRQRLIAVMGSVILVGLTKMSFAAWKAQQQQQLAVTHYREMTNTYQRVRVYCGSFAGNLYEAYLDHRTAAVRLGSVQRHVYSLERSFSSVTVAQEFALAFEAHFPHVPNEMHGYHPAESPLLVVWARPSDFGAIQSFVTDHDKR